MSHRDYRYLEITPWKAYKASEEAAEARGERSRGVYVDANDEDEVSGEDAGGGDFVACTLFPTWGYPEDSRADEVAECVNYVLDPVNNVKALAVRRFFPQGETRREVTAHVFRLLARLPPGVRHLKIEAGDRRLPPELYACWAPISRHPSGGGFCPLVSLRMTLAYLTDGAAVLAEAIRDKRMPHLKELRWEANETGDRDDRKITDEIHIEAYSGLVQACVDSAHVEVLVMHEWFVLRASALAGLASGVSTLRVLHLECAELVVPHPHVTEGRHDDSLVPHPHPRGLNDTAARLLAASLQTCLQLEELHVRTKWFRTHESCRLLEDGLRRSPTLRKLCLLSVHDDSYKPGSVVPAVLAGLRQNRSVREFEMHGCCGEAAARHEHYYGEQLDDPLSRNLLELVLNDNLTLRTFKLWERRRVEESVLYVLHDNRRFAELCAAAKSRIAGGSDGTGANDRPWRRGLMDHACERTAGSLVNVTALYLLLRHDPSPDVLQRIRARHDSRRSARFAPTADHIPRIIRRRLIREANDPASIDDRADRGPRRRLPDIAAAPLLAHALGWESY
jgi:hypothetical protein